MDIGIIGGGNVGGTLGRAWSGKGHRVCFGVPDPAAPKVADLLARAGANCRAGSVAEAAAFAEVVALTVPWGAVPDALRAAGDLSGKVLLDCTNPNFSSDPSGPEAGHGNSGGEQVAALAPGASVVKIFNTTGFENMADPHYGNGEVVTMFYAGNEPGSKVIAKQLASEIGFEPVDVGPLSFAHHLEALAQLWGQLAYGEGLGRSLAFRLVRR